MAPLSIAAYMTTAVLVSVGVLHTMVWGRVRDQRIHLIFGLTALIGAANAVAELAFYQANSVPEFSTAFKRACSINVLWLMFFVWFVGLFAGGSRVRRWWAASLMGVFLAAGVINLMLPYGFLYARIDELRMITLPWGEPIATANGPASPLRIITDVSLLGMLVFVIDAGLRLRRRQEHRRAAFLGGAVALFSIALLVGSLIDVGVVRMPYPMTYVYLIVALAMSYELVGEVVRASRLAVEIKAAQGERDRALEEATKALRAVEALKSRLEEEVVYLTNEVETRGRFKDIVGESDTIQYVLRQIEQVAPAKTTVLIEGETGVGKELVARAIHAHSSRNGRPMIAVNICALASTLMEAELFGHERGAFTGATRTRRGRFELADGGTLFLDEIAEMPLDVQGKLLRVLQDGEFTRVGGERTLKVDVRLIAATNRNLRALVDSSSFREDLFYRLHVYPITVPALRQRREDIPLLVRHFARMYADSLGRPIESIPKPVLDELVAYDWPGNVRELQNVIERAVVTSLDSDLRLATRLVRAEIDQLAPMTTAARNPPLDYRGSLDAVERDYILGVLESQGWRIEGQAGAARILGLHPNTLRSRMRKHGIERPKRDVARPP